MRSVTQTLATSQNAIVHPVIMRFPHGYVSVKWRSVKCIPALLAASALSFAADAPPTPVHPVTDVYHGVKVIDDYRWLEDFSNPEVKQWVARQNAYTVSVLDKIGDRQHLKQELFDLLAKRSTSFRDVVVCGKQIFALKSEASRQQPALVVFSSANASPDEAKTVVDPMVIDASGSTAIDWFVPSNSNRYVAVSLSKGGSESGDLHIYEVANGKELSSDSITRVQNGTAGGSLAWDQDDGGFFYTRYPRPGERPASDLDFYQQIYFHKLGDSPANDRYELGKDFPRIAEIVFQSSQDGKRILASVANGDGGDFLHFLRTPDGVWHQVAQYSDQVRLAHFGSDDSIYLLSKVNAPMGKILHMGPSEYSAAKAKLIVPESGVAIEDFVAGANHLYVADLAGGPSQVRRFLINGKPIGTIPLDRIAAVDDIRLLGSDDVLFLKTSYTSFPSWVTYSSAEGKVNGVRALFSPPAINLDDAEVIREFATSKDGTRVPLNIIRKKGTPVDGNQPLILTGYGGYNISEKPYASALVRLLLNHGVTFVTTNLRGGGEYGDRWHLAGNLTHKQNVFDDFYACAQYLLERKYTSPARLGIVGGSNGGLLMGASLTQHPETFRAVASFVGIYDMLRVELSPNGSFNVTEFGTVKEQDQFNALYAYSPYHHVRSGVAYPATIFLTGDNDPRVDPANSRKMVARLQAVADSKGPILLRTSSNAGHGIGSSLNEAVSQMTDAYSFLLNQLGVN